VDDVPEPPNGEAEWRDTSSSSILSPPAENAGNSSEQMGPRSSGPKWPWFAGSAFALVVLLAGHVLGGTLLVVGLGGLVAGVIGLKRGAVPIFRVRTQSAALVLTLLSIVIVLIGTGVNAGEHPTQSGYDPGSASIRTLSPTPTPTRSQTPIPMIQVIDFRAQAGEVASDALTTAGFIVELRTLEGEVVPDPTGWVVSGQSVQPGTLSPQGARVTLVLEMPPPPPPPAPAPVEVVPGGGATALCNDGTLSYSAHHQGTCSHHGGVRTWYK
jgi:hypothetical protein